jgi:hypothetical protein
MSNMVTGFLLALDGNFDQGRCLTHVGTEGALGAFQAVCVALELTPDDGD